MDESQLSASQRDALNKTVLSFVADGLDDQSKLGSMPCAQVRTQIDRTIKILQSVK